MKVGYVNIFGKPNAGKSTLLNALLGQKLAIVSPKVQTTRHRIKGILTEKNYQIIFSDTPGIITPKYKLHEKMMAAVKQSLEDADVAILLVDAYEDPEEAGAIFESLRLKAPALLVLNKIDAASADQLAKVRNYFADKPYSKQVFEIAAKKSIGVDKLLATIIDLLPEGEPFYDEEDMTDLPTRFFVGELVREQIYQLYQDEIPYHTTVLVNEFKEKTTLTKIRADIVVQRESQKGILLGAGGSMIKKLGTRSREAIEQFLDQKVFLELHVKVRPKWRDNDLYLREYGYH